MLCALQVCAPNYGSTGFNMSIANGTATPPCGIYDTLKDLEVCGFLTPSKLETINSKL